MSKPNHVPKFGNWDANEELPFTIVFEKARADHKGGTVVGGTMISPNNVIQNPKAFGMKSTKAPQSSQRTLQQYNTNGSQKRADRMWAGPNVTEGSMRSTDMNHAKKGEQTPGHPSSSLRVHPGNRSAVLAYLGPDQKGVHGGSTISHHPTSGKRHLRPASRGEDMFPGRGSPLPKFGAWDEKDPTAGDGFTLIFGNARKEKIIGGPTPIPTHQSEISFKEDYEDVYQPPLQSYQQKVARWLCCARS